VIERIIKTFKVIIFGKTILDGYYTPPKKSKRVKKYVLSSVFPSSESMKKVLSELAYENK